MTLNKNNENKLVPKLRFPKFVNKGNWNACDLINTADKNIRWSFTGGPFGSNLKAEDYTENGIRIIQLQNIGDGEFIDENKIYTSVEKADELLSCNIYSDEIILSKMGDPVGRACIMPKHIARCLMASDGIRLVVDEKKYSKFFIYSLINSKQIRDAIERKSTGSTRKRIGLDELKKISLPISSLIEEQQKIADCLSSLDDVINAERQKLKVLKEHKKGLLQNLFPQEGEALPKLRFSEFLKNGKWDKKKLGEIGEFTGGGTPSKDNKSFWEGDIPWISSSDIDEESIYSFRISRFISEEALKISATKKVPANSVLLVSRVGVGKLAITYKPICTSQDFTNFTPNNQDLIFVAYCLKNQKETLLGFSQGMAIKGFTKDDISNLKIQMPSIKEQHKIASCLSSLDDLITAQNQKVEALKYHKKGLLQGLFPNVNEVNE